MKKYKMNEKFEEYTEEEMIERYGFIPGFDDCDYYPEEKDYYEPIEENKCKVIKFPMSSDEVNMKNKKCDYKTLAIMTLHSNHTPSENHRYVYKKDILLNKEEIESLSKNQIDTICRNIKKLCKLESKIVEAKSTENGIVYLINYATEYIDEYGGISYRKFVPIEEDILKFLIDTSSSNAIKTYIYLKYRCVDKDYNSKETKITRMEIANNIGLSVKSDNNLKTVMNIVKSLENNKLIKTSRRYVTEVSPNGNEVVKCYKFFKVNEYDEWLLENKK